MGKRAQQAERILQTVNPADAHITLMLSLFESNRAFTNAGALLKQHK
jgi:hypothetical protein